MSSHKYSFEVYTKEGCSQCVQTKKWLELKKAAFVEKDALKNLELIRSADVGMRAPAVAFLVDGNQVLFWTGFRPSLMEELLSSTVAGNVR